MTFRDALQALCDEHQVKLVPGMVQRGDTLAARLMAYKVVEGEERAQEIPALYPAPPPEVVEEVRPDRLRL